MCLKEGGSLMWHVGLYLSRKRVEMCLISSEGELVEHFRAPAKAIEAWRSIIEWNESRGHTRETEWPSQELERLRSTLVDWPRSSTRTLIALNLLSARNRARPAEVA